MKVNKQHVTERTPPALYLDIKHMTIKTQNTTIRKAASLVYPSTNNHVDIGKLTDVGISKVQN